MAANFVSVALRPLVGSGKWSAHVPCRSYLGHIFLLHRPFSFLFILIYLMFGLADLVVANGQSTHMCLSWLQVDRGGTCRKWRGVV